MMEKMFKYQPISHDGDLGRTSEEEKSTLLHGRVALRSNLSWLSRTRNIFVTAFVILSYSLLVVGITLKVVTKNKAQGTRILKPLANDYISYETQVWPEWENVTVQNTVDPDAPLFFTGEPSAKINKNWHDLLEPMNVRLPASYMEELGRTEQGIQFPDGTYLGTLMVFHNLHCLKSIYHALHPKEFGVDKMTDKQKFHWQDHTEHCLHMVKNAIMCQADPSIVTMKWPSEGVRPVGNMTNPHECVNWDRLMEWVDTNTIDVTGDGLLIHPTLGPLFENGRLTEVAQE